MLPGSSPALLPWPQAGDPAASPNARGDQLEACKRIVERAVERVAARFDLGPLVEDVQDLLDSGGAAPLLELLSQSPVAQLALVGVGVVVSKIPRSTSAAAESAAAPANNEGSET